jgi:hypothetical protein
MADIMAPGRSKVWAESSPDTRWLSYDDLAEIAGIKRESVTRMVRRKKWPKRTGNEPGSVRVAVPLGAIEAMQARQRARPPVVEQPIPDRLSLNLADIARVIHKLETALSETSAERDQLRFELERERMAATLARHLSEHSRIAAAEERTRTAGQHARLNAQISALAAELARLHAAPRVTIQEAPLAPTPLLARVGSIARWLRS